MTTEVRFHRGTTKDLATWIQQQDRRLGGHPAMTETLLDEMTAELKKTEGRPLGAFYVPTLSPPRWVWRFSADTWISYVRQTKRYGFFGSVRLKIVVLSIASTTPSATAP